MPVSERAKIFAPFAALKGLPEALAEKERPTMERRDLSEDVAEDLNRILTQLQPNQVICCVYYSPMEQVEKTITGEATLLKNQGCLQLDNIRIPLADIIGISF